MAKILTFEISENEVEQLQNLLEQFHVEAVKSREIMKRDQTEIEQSRAEYRLIRENIDKSAAESKILLADLSRRILKAA